MAPAPKGKKRSAAPGDDEHANEQRPKKSLRQATNKAASDREGDKGDSSPFLELPAELRNAVYEYVAIDACGALHRRTRGKLASRTALCRVSKQVRDEYHAVLYMTTPYIEAHVKDFDFGHIVTFLNKLSDRELNALPTSTIPTHRKLRVHIRITQACPHNPEGLQKWLLRRQHPTKKGTRIEVEYTTEGRKSTVTATEVIHFAPYHVWDTLMKKLEQLEKTTSEGRNSPLYKELKKVVDAVYNDRGSA